MTKRIVPPEVSAFFKKIGEENGRKLREEVKAGIRPKDYFSKISKMRKTFGRQAKPKNPEQSS